MTTSYWSLVLIILLFPLAALTAKFVEFETTRLAIRHVRRSEPRERTARR
jgi:hypothetical protein